jgi:hypothetical protein
MTITVNLTKRFVFHLLLGLFPSLVLAAPGIQEVLTPAQYFECRIAALEATVPGMEERAGLLNKQGTTVTELNAVGDRSQARVTMALYACGRQNGSTLAAYAHRNAEDLRTWLNANPQVKARLDAMNLRVATLAAQMPSVSPSAKR